ncbi:hypothetical protein SARC_02289 [Sphaeroforma arctica JP610]|uniref:Cap-specific mRNA (nucleoside-2'-O-)-methyltransferase 1 n=1 Tax=Sphaeroforma arctica JP610 TaxID=667725 RepID=A0A0L0GB97_9EUKA|nr:hypothetical protein SARC_02289 [Sphaeroforma arctica JP610]KNC85528.1 hypothetical protein SARC_02289 [Sphaeroforma arctica JP610]|eukprot:XP_014159430.1 hypothetical protein SARC_02289 [Sphaeroforma arctica JP610]
MRTRRNDPSRNGRDDDTGTYGEALAGEDGAEGTGAVIPKVSFGKLLARANRDDESEMSLPKPKHKHKHRHDVHSEGASVSPIKHKHRHRYQQDGQSTSASDTKQKRIGESVYERDGDMEWSGSEGSDGGVHERGHTYTHGHSRAKKHKKHKKHKKESKIRRVKAIIHTGSTSDANYEGHTNGVLDMREGVIGESGLMSRYDATDSQQETKKVTDEEEDDDGAHTRIDAPLPPQVVIDPEKAVQEANSAHTHTHTRAHTVAGDTKEMREGDGSSDDMHTHERKRSKGKGGLQAKSRREGSQDKAKRKRTQDSSVHTHVHAHQEDTGTEVCAPATVNAQAQSSPMLVPARLVSPIKRKRPGRPAKRGTPVVQKTDREVKIEDNSVGMHSTAQDDHTRDRAANDSGKGDGPTKKDTAQNSPTRLPKKSSAHTTLPVPTPQPMAPTTTPAHTQPHSAHLDLEHTTQATELQADTQATTTHIDMSQDSVAPLPTSTEAHRQLASDALTPTDTITAYYRATDTGTQIVTDTVDQNATDIPLPTAMADDGFEYEFEEEVLESSGGPVQRRDIQPTENTYPHAAADLYSQSNASTYSQSAANTYPPSTAHTYTHTTVESYTQPPMQAYVGPQTTTTEMSSYNNSTQLPVQPALPPAPPAGTTTDTATTHENTYTAQMGEGTHVATGLNASVQAGGYVSHPQQYQYDYATHTDTTQLKRARSSGMENTQVAGAVSALLGLAAATDSFVDTREISTAVVSTSGSVYGDIPTQTGMGEHTGAGTAGGGVWSAPTTQHTTGPSETPQAVSTVSEVTNQQPVQTTHHSTTRATSGTREQVQPTQDTHIAPPRTNVVDGTRVSTTADTAEARDTPHTQSVDTSGAHVSTGNTHSAVDRTERDSGGVAECTGMDSVPMRPTEGDGMVADVHAQRTGLQQRQGLSQAHGACHVSQVSQDESHGLGSGVASAISTLPGRVDATVTDSSVLVDGCVESVKSMESVEDDKSKVSSEVSTGVSTGRTGTGGAEVRSSFSNISIDRTEKGSAAEPVGSERPPSVSRAGLVGANEAGDLDETVSVAGTTVTVAMVTQETPGSAVVSGMATTSSPHTHLRTASVPNKRDPTHENAPPLPTHDESSLTGPDGRLIIEQRIAIPVGQGTTTSTLQHETIPSDKAELSISAKEGMLDGRADQVILVVDVADKIKYDNQTNNNQTSENQTNDKQPGEIQTSDNRTTDNQTNDEQTNDNQTNDNQLHGEPGATQETEVLSGETQTGNLRGTIREDTEASITEKTADGTVIEKTLRKTIKDESASSRTIKDESAIDDAEAITRDTPSQGTGNEDTAGETGTPKGTAKADTISATEGEQVDVGDYDDWDYQGGGLGGLGQTRGRGGLGFSAADESAGVAIATEVGSIGEDMDSENEGEHTNTYSRLGAKLLKAKGWTEGTGLGLHAQGIVEPIKADDNAGRTGLGFQKEKPLITRKRHAVDLNEYVPHKQQYTTISHPDEYDPQWGASLLTSGGETLRPVVAPHESINYDLFGDSTVVERLFEAKSQFNGLERREFITARRKANPYETIGKGGNVFINRAAVKMANMDSMLNWIFTSPEGLAFNEPLLFADVCAGPGGFSEYVLWKREKRCKGYGFTLRGPDDFKPYEFNRQPTEPYFETFYGADGTGDVTNEANIRAFTKLTSIKSNKTGLHLMMADGGFSVEGEENYQEEILKQLVLCQFTVALSVLRKGGNFVCKIFDMFTPFTVGLVYVMYKHFDEVCILKPFTSRPANSERYIICLGLKERSPAVVEWLLAINAKLNEFGEWGMEGADNVAHIVAPEVISADKQFTDYVRQANIALGEQQIGALNTLMMYCEDDGLQPLDQHDIMRRCLKEWNVDVEYERRLKSMKRRNSNYDNMYGGHSGAKRLKSGLPSGPNGHGGMVGHHGSIGIGSGSEVPERETARVEYSMPDLTQPSKHQTIEDYEEAQRDVARQRSAQYGMEKEWRKPFAHINTATSNAPSATSSAAVSRRQSLVENGVPRTGNASGGSSVLGGVDRNSPHSGGAEEGDGDAEMGDADSKRKKVLTTAATSKKKKKKKKAMDLDAAFFG